MKINVAIVAGGDSSEYQISVNSAGQVAKHLDQEKYNTFIVLIRGNHWFLQSERYGDVAISKDDFSCLIDGKELKFDVVFNAIHGTPGEDGKLQGYFEMIGIPYTSSGPFTSALTFNKFACKVYLKEFTVLTARAILVRSAEDWQEKVSSAGISFPCFVKPNNGGSSFGVSRVTGPEDLPAAIERARKEDNEVIIEEFIPGTEITCGICRTGEEEIIFPLTEVISKKEFFDVEAKYTAGMADEVTPARIGEADARKIRELSSRICSVLNCRGIVRIDYILSGGTPFFLEINTVPGMSAESIVPKQAVVYGLTLPRLYDMLIGDALSRTRE